MMAYLAPSEFVTRMIDAGESKVFMSTRDTIVRAYMAGAILALAAWFAVTINVQTGQPLAGAILFPVGFCILYLFGFDLLTGVFVLCPLAWLDKRRGVTIGGVLRNWGLVFVGNFGGAFTVAFMMAYVTTFGFTEPPDKVGTVIGTSVRPERSAMQRTARPAWRRCSFAACCATGWSQPASSAP
jgi:formate/nitrite transporter FocA (FNT family)